jgi:hypothetical protein
MKNTFFLTEKDKIITLTAFCEKQNRDYAACLKNAVNFKIHERNFEGACLCAFTHANSHLLKDKYSQQKT